MNSGIPAMWMRGGTSKGVYFLASDLPADAARRDEILLRIMGSPDSRQIDGIGGGDSLTSKAAIISPAKQAGADVDYLFLQVGVDRAAVSAAQNCGNILAGVGPFAIERGLAAATGETTEVVIRMENTGQIAVATAPTPDGRVCYEGATCIDGVPGGAAAIPIVFSGVAGAACGALLPTGNPADAIDGHAATLIDGGMPCVILSAREFGVSGGEAPEVLENDRTLRVRLEAIRHKAGPMMNLGDVREKTIPKMTLVSPPARGGAISTRSFIPHRCHRAIGVFAAVSIGAACLLPRGPAAEIAAVPAGADKTICIEHPAGAFPVVAAVGADGEITRAGIVRTARKLMDGVVFP
jgi:4-oxalomesaconate tautomerase